MTISYEEGDSLKGDLIVGRARKLSKPRIVVFSGRHKSQQLMLQENAFCRIEKKLRFVK